MDSGDQYGPALPPGTVKTEPISQEDVTNKRKVIGPALPPGMQKSTDSDDMSDEGQLKMDADLSPDKPDDGDDEDGVVGPMPSEMSHDGEDVVQAVEEFEKRAKRMKDKLTIKAEAQEGPSKREEWMTELPPEMGKNFGLQNRTFAKGDGGQGDDKDRSIWTDTPNIKKEKESKGKKRKREEDKAASARDEQMQQQVDEYNKTKRPESLMDMHTKKQKKKKKKEKKEKKKRKERGEKEEKQERRPFDRDKDLQVNRFDDAQRKAVIKKSQLLNSRFKHGGSSSSFL